MFVFNFKVNMKKILIFTIIFAVIIGILIEIDVFNIRKNLNNKDVDIYNKEKDYDYIINETNFTNMLKDIHENINKNIGKTVKISGFVFTMPDFKETYFVCGRNMILSGNDKVVGFLCNYDKAEELLESEWVEVTGTIQKGFYQTDMPVIEVEKLNKITEPENTYVDPPTVVNK